MELGKALYLLQIGGKMETKEIEVNNKKYKIKELTLEESFALGDSKDKIEINRKMLKLSVIEPQIDDEFIKNLSLRDGVKLITAINELNGFGEKDFLTAPKT